jgi:hypothetical protein
MKKVGPSERPWDMFTGTSMLLSPREGSRAFVEYLPLTVTEAGENVSGEVECGGVSGRR